MEIKKNSISSIEWELKQLLDEYNSLNDYVYTEHDYEFSQYLKCRIEKLMIKYPELKVDLKPIKFKRKSSESKNKIIIIIIVIALFILMVIGYYTYTRF